MTFHKVTGNNFDYYKEIQLLASLQRHVGVLAAPLQIHIPSFLSNPSPWAQAPPPQPHTWSTYTQESAVTVYWLITSDWKIPLHKSSEADRMY